MRLILIHILFSMVAVAHAFDAPYDLDSVHWGLTEAQVSEFLPALVPETADTGARILRDNKVHWKQITFGSSFVFDGEGLLRSIQLSALSTNKNLEQDANTIEASLLRQFGDPIEARRAEHGYRRLVWSDSKHEVNLIFAPKEGFGRDTLTLVYSKPRE